VGVDSGGRTPTSRARGDDEAPATGRADDVRGRSRPGVPVWPLQSPVAAATPSNAKAAAMATRRAAAASPRAVAVVSHDALAMLKWYA
jgi:hypothetical protein